LKGEDLVNHLPSHLPALLRQLNLQPADPHWSKHISADDFEHATAAHSAASGDGGGGDGGGGGGGSGGGSDGDSGGGGGGGGTKSNRWFVRRFVQQLKWQKRNYYRVEFPCAAEEVQYILQRLREIAIGVELPPTQGRLGSNKERDTIHRVGQQLKANGSVYILNMTVCKPLPPKQRTDGAHGTGERAAKTLHALWHIEKIIDDTKAGAALTVDYNILVIVASLLAGVGLIENNTVVIVASMLVSPIMGPILATTFGFVLRDRHLSLRYGVLNEILSLVVCVLVGFALGVVCVFGFAQRDPIYLGHDATYHFPTDEMTGRATKRGILVGLAIAIPPVNICSSSQQPQALTLILAECCAILWQVWLRRWSVRVKP